MTTANVLMHDAAKLESLAIDLRKVASMMSGGDLGQKIASVLRTGPKKPREIVKALGVPPNRVYNWFRGHKKMARKTKAGWSLKH